MFLAIALIATPVGAADPPQEEIVVPAQHALDALDTCLAASSPPTEDIRLSIAPAEQLFRDGDYRAARSVLARPILPNSITNGEPAPSADR